MHAKSLKSCRMLATVSNVPACTIDLSVLNERRFLIKEARRLPYRDEAGLVNAELVAISHKEITDGTFVAPPEVLASRIISLGDTCGSLLPCMSGSRRFANVSLHGHAKHFGGVAM